MCFLISCRSVDNRSRDTRDRTMRQTRSYSPGPDQLYVIPREIRLKLNRINGSRFIVTTVRNELQRNRGVSDPPNRVGKRYVSETKGQ